MTTRPTAESINLYTDALSRWCAAKRDYPALANPEPNRKDYALDEWTAEAVKKSVVRDFNRTV